MIKATVLRYAAIGMASMSLAGFAAASSVSVSNTGPDSHQVTHLKNTHKVTTSNVNDINGGNLSAQESSTGHVSAYGNTSVGGDLYSGRAHNNSMVHTDVMVDNAGSASSGSSMGSSVGTNSTVSYDTTGPDSYQETNITNSNEVSTTNKNHVNVWNVNLQHASSGNVSANHNTTVGGLSSGDATNSNTTTSSVSLSN